MLKLLCLLLAVASAVLSTALFKQGQRVRNLEAQIAAIQAETGRDLAEQQAEVAQLQERQEVFKRESEDLRKKLADRTAPAAATGAAEAKSEKSGGFGDFFKGMEKMFKDPAMKKAMKSQQTMAIQMMYGDLVKELGLAPDEATLLFDLLAERQMTVSGKVFEGGNSGKAAEAAATEAQKSNEGFDAEIKNLLGEERAKKFEKYERTVGERMTLQQVTQSMAALGSPLEDRQRAALLDIMSEERLKQPPGKFDSGNKDIAGAMKAMRTGEGMDDAMQKQREFNQRVSARARGVLSPDQALAFEKAQQQMVEMQEMGMKMLKGMSEGGGKK